MKTGLCNNRMKLTKPAMARMDAGFAAYPGVSRTEKGMRRRTHFMGNSVARVDVDALLSTLTGLGDVSREVAVGALAGYGCRKGLLQLTRATRKWVSHEPLRLPNAHETMRQAVAMAESFSYLVTNAQLIRRPVPHLRAEHPWQTPVSYGIDTFLAFRVEPRGFICVNIRRRESA